MRAFEFGKHLKASNVTTSLAVARFNSCNFNPDLRSKIFLGGACPQTPIMGTLCTLYYAALTYR